MQCYKQQNFLALNQQINHFIIIAKPQYYYYEYDEKQQYQIDPEQPKIQQQVINYDYYVLDKCVIYSLHHHYINLRSMTFIS